jgi:hypothetical protein
MTYVLSPPSKEAGFQCLLGADSRFREDFKTGDECRV